MRPAGIYKSHDLLTYFSWSADFSRFCMVTIFVIGRFFNSTDGNKLILYYKLYLCETSSVCFHTNSS